jgi:GAF domain-containing protein
MTADVMPTPNAEPNRALAEVLAEFARMMAEEQSVQSVLERASDYCLSLLPVDGVGVLLLADDGGLTVATANSKAGQIVEELEAELGEGPCSKSMRTGRQVPVPDLAAAQDEFPQFAPRALQAGVRSIHAIPMTVKTEQVGSLNVIAMRPLALSVEDLATAQLLTDVAISYIANSRLLGEQTLLAEQLQRALDSRVLLEQAKGTLAERHGISPEEAFERLRAHARREREKVQDIARRVLTGELRI